MKEGVRWAVRAFAREIKEEVRDDVAYMDWVVM